jgi:pentatricopeptide repeat protein
LRCHFLVLLKAIGLPRQARDKHRESTQKESGCVFSQEEDLAYASQLLATLERIQKEGLPRNRALYLALLRSAGRARQARLVFRVFEEMKREGIKPDNTVYTHLLNACRQCGRLQACEAIFMQMKEHTPPLVNSVRNRPSFLRHQFILVLLKIEYFFMHLPRQARDKHAREKS